MWPKLTQHEYQPGPWSYCCFSWPQEALKCSQVILIRVVHMVSSQLARNGATVSSSSEDLGQ